ncbi:TPA: hypothetical protein ACNG4L_000711 [Enterobacter hormaechei]|nr:hypothetical protein [Enterobacter hormaechei]
MSTITKEFTKDQLIARTEMRLAMVAGFPESKLAQMDKCLAKIAQAVLKAEPFLYAIADSEGEAHLDEFCVAYGEDALVSEISALNEMAESPGEEYKAVPVYRLPMLEGLK